MKSKQGASFKDQLATILKSYKKAVDTIIDEADFLKKATAEIDQLTLKTSQSIKRTEKIQEKILHTKQEFIDYQKKCREKAEKLVKISKENLPKWLLDEIKAKDQAKTHVKTEKVAETDQAQMLPPVNEVTLADGGRDNNEAISKLEIRIQIMSPTMRYQTMMSIHLRKMFPLKSKKWMAYSMKEQLPKYVSNLDFKP